MCSKQFKNILEKELHQHNYATLSFLKKKLHQSQDATVIREALTYRHEHKQFEILCFVTYEENNVIYSKYEVDSYVQQLLRNRKAQGKPIKDIFVEFLCVFRTQAFHFNQIVQMMIDSTKEMYTAALQHQIERKLTVIPPNAIMKNGKKYSQMHPTQSKATIAHTTSKGSIVSTDHKKQPLQKSKSHHNQLPRMNQSKAQIKKQEPTKHHQKPTKKEQKKSVPHRKLQIQSDQSQDYYVPQKFIQTLQNKSVHKNEPMQLQNQGNYKQNQVPHHYQPQKMQIQTPAEKPNHKQNSPGTNTNVDDEEDSMAQFMQEMNKHPTKPIENKSLGGKSLPAVKQTKLEFAQVKPTKTVASKQGSLFGWMGKK